MNLWIQVDRGASVRGSLKPTVSLRTSAVRSNSKLDYLFSDSNRLRAPDQRSASIDFVGFNGWQVDEWNF